MQPSAFERVIEALDGMSLSQLQRLVHEAEVRRRQAEALAEVEENAGDAPSCARCGSGTVVRWGCNDSGRQRRRCRECGDTQSAPEGRLTQPPTLIQLK